MLSPATNWPEISAGNVTELGCSVGGVSQTEEQKQSKINDLVLQPHFSLYYRVCVMYFYALITKIKNKLVKVLIANIKVQTIRAIKNAFSSAFYCFN